MKYRAFIFVTPIQIETVYLNCRLPDFKGLVIVAGDGACYPIKEAYYDSRNDSMNYFFGDVDHGEIKRILKEHQ
jgi:hypothetical protein